MINQLMGNQLPPMQGGFGQPVSYSTGQQMAVVQAQLQDLNSN